MAAIGITAGGATGTNTVVAEGTGKLLPPSNELPLIARLTLPVVETKLAIPVEMISVPTA